MEVKKGIMRFSSFPRHRYCQPASGNEMRLIGRAIPTREREAPVKMVTKGQVTLSFEAL